MEKLKPTLKKIKQHHFWVLILLATVVVLYCWNASVAEMEKVFKSNKIAVKTQFTNLKTQSQRPEFPNEEWVEKTIHI